MKEISFPIISEKKSGLFRGINFWFFCLVGINLILQLERHSFKDQLLVISIGLIIGLNIISDLKSIADRRKIPIFDSFLILSATSIRIENGDEVEEYTLDELISITLSVNETSFDPNPRGLIDKRKSGEYNWVEIKIAEETYYKYSIYIDSADEIEKLDLFLVQANEKKYLVKRKGMKVESIKKTHYSDVPLHYKETRRSKMRSKNRFNQIP